MTEFSLRFGAHRLAGYRSGEGGIPLLVVHGGPGVPCSYVYEAHKNYAAEGFDVVSWDQLGCGRSDRPEDASLWVVDRFVEEVETVREQLGWDSFFLLGNSWGGMLGIEYCLAHLDRVRAFVIGNSAASMPRLIRGFDRCKQALGSDTARMMALREAEGSIDHPEYLAARTLLTYRHMCRMDHWPEPLVEGMRAEGIGVGPFSAMFGPHFYNCSGNLRDWDRMADLPRIAVPTLVTTSEWDYLLPEYARLMWEHLPQSEIVIFRNSGHLPFWDAADRYHPAVLGFLKTHAGLAG
ncbi:proline iminopeptidase-family hydrolase [Mesorhizobium sp. BR1-1-16]|uniref:proline iminopeptidase-family hydrolase n=1 Tax=Mesorhizobium sp. BR1-1-16 TaxID=2876653 RepID=UPI001CCFEC0A|nr:proline iminopeptidase-family hydrolase [Mesorhizobium sp. BR1-1-16]MBZ9939280.1 proline iminopeptidase-family hydrolase [Mesorhizobium sp. BR1-1-16]